MSCVSKFTCGFGDTFGRHAKTRADMQGLRPEMHKNLWEMLGCGGRVGLAARHAKDESRHARVADRDAKTSCLEPNRNEIVR